MWFNNNQQFAITKAKLAAAEAEISLLKLKTLNHEADPAAMTRKLLKVFDPALIGKSAFDDEDSAVDVLTDQGDENEQLAFLRQCHDLYENKALPLIVSYLIRNQILWIAKKAASFEHVNAGRFSINGASLVQEEIERLNKVFKERTAPKEIFEEHSAV